MSFGASRVIIKDDGTVVFPGIDHENRKLTVHYRWGDILVVHVTGGTCWNGVGMPRAYAGARFEVVRITGKSKRTKYLGGVGEEFPCVPVVDFNIKKEKR